MAADDPLNRPGGRRQFRVHRGAAPGDRPWRPPTGVKDPDDPSSSGSPFAPIRIPSRESQPTTCEADLLDACRSGNVQAAREALSAGARADFAVVAGDLGDDGGSFERTPLMIACMAGHFEVAQLLLTSGANPSRRMKDGSSALTVAAYEGHGGIVDLLLEHGVEVDHTALACSLPFRRGPEMLLHLLVRGANADACGPVGRTLLHRACELRDVAIVDILLAHGASPNAQDDFGATPLHHALGHMHLAGKAPPSDDEVLALRRIMRRMLAAGGDVERKDRAGRSFVDLLGMNPDLVARIERIRDTATPTPLAAPPKPAASPASPPWKPSGRKSSWPH